MQRRRTVLLLAGLGCALLAIMLTVHTLPAVAATANITIIDFSFLPASKTINVDDTVTWTNSDGFQHTVTSDAPVNGISFDSGPLPTSGANSFSFTFNQAGVYAYSCTIHPSMHGTITVVSQPAPTATGSTTFNHTLYLPVVDK